MTREKIHLYDTTLRDGQQTHGVAFSFKDKTRIATALDALGIDYIEGGWPGANPTDSDFFETPPKLNSAIFTAFGMTKRAGYSAQNDSVLAAVMNANTPAVCLVGKTHDFHVSTALNISLDENLENIDKSIRYIVQSGREALFDCEHFFDGYSANPNYALQCALTAYTAGARWVVLCDTNGGAMPDQVRSATRAVIDAGVPRGHIGIHTHNDTEHAVANSLAAVDAGARQIQGTLNGLGERCGNANLITLIPTLLLKEPYASQYETAINPANLAQLTRISRMLDDILNRIPHKQAAYVGASAFAHKAGLHASAIVKNPNTYEHIAPDLVGNQRIVPMSNQAGQSNLRTRLEQAGIKVEKGDVRLLAILEEVKLREDKGYAYDIAQASFEILARKILGELPHYFSVESYDVQVKTAAGANGLQTVSRASVALRIGGEEKISSYENPPRAGADDGPVHALSRALMGDLGAYQTAVQGLQLVDYKVRIINGGTEAVTRVVIDYIDETGQHLSTVGCSSNILDASFQAQCDAIYWKLLSAGVSPV